MYALPWCCLYSSSVSFCAVSSLLVVPILCVHLCWHTCIILVTLSKPLISSFLSILLYLWKVLFTYLLAYYFFSDLNGLGLHQCSSSKLPDGFLPRVKCIKISNKSFYDEILVKNPFFILLFDVRVVVDWLFVRQELIAESHVLFCRSLAVVCVRAKMYLWNWIWPMFLLVEMLLFSS